MQLSDDDFTLFQLPRRFALGAEDLAARWKGLQAAAHPDRFASEGAAAQRLAMQWAVRINEAYQRLRQPVSRGAYLCELAGHAVQAENNTAMPAAFLMQQMAWREALDEAQDPAAVEALADEVVATRRDLLAALQSSIDERVDWAQAAAQVRALMFIERFSRDVDRRLAALEQ
jgi:molecular chaperone HscB